MNKPRRKPRESQESYIKRAALLLRNGGYLIPEIAIKLNTDPLTIYVSLGLNSKNPTTSQEDIYTIRSMKNAGCSNNEIMISTGKCESTIYNRYNYDPKYHDNTVYLLTDDDIEYIKQYYIDGKTISWISRFVNTPRASVISRLKLARLYEKGYTDTVTEITYNEKKEIRTLLNQGYTNKKISYIVGRPIKILLPYINYYNKKKGRHI